MKKTLPLLFFCNLLFSVADAQQFTIVPNPDVPDLFAYTPGGKYPYSGYAGSPVAYNGNLYVQYQGANSTFAVDYKMEIARYNSDNTLTTFANPDGGMGWVFQSQSIVFNNKLYIQYKTAGGYLVIGVFDGSALTLLSPPAGGENYLGAPIIYNGNLYVEYELTTSVQVLAKVDVNDNVTVISNPDATPYGYYGSPAIYNNKLYMVYISNDANNPNCITQFDGTTVTKLPNPDSSPYGYQGLPVVFNNKLYGTYYSNGNQFQLIQYDGTNNPSLISNPTNNQNDGFIASPLVYNGALYINYRNGTPRQLGKFDGTSLTLIPNPDATQNGYGNVPLIYNSKICLLYENVSGTTQLGEYDGGDTIHLVPNPDGSSSGVWDYPIVYGTHIFYQYLNAGNTFQLSFFDGTKMSLVPNPGGFYGGYPIIFNNQLFAQIVGTTYGATANLAYSTQSLLPVEILNLTATAQGNNTLVQWQTANEINNKEFNVERSADGLTFSSIGTVPAQPVSGKGNYSFTDDKPLDGMNFYRLKQIDLDGQYNYSKIVSVNFSGLSKAFTVYPNPAKDNVTLTLPVITSNTTISIYTMDGRKVYEEQVAPNTANKNISVTGLAAGTYNIVLSQQGKQQTLKMVKGSN